MPYKHNRKNKTMKGGFWNSLTQGFTNAWEKTKKATTDIYSSATGSTSSATPTYSKGYMGGKSRRRRIRGGFKDNTPTTGLATHAASFSGKTAQPHNWVGGKTKRYRKYRR
jgi:hypothetical protein